MVSGIGLKKYLRKINLSEYHIVVICLLPKQKTRVRFSLLAQNRFRTKAKLTTLDIHVKSGKFNNYDIINVVKNY